MDKPNDVDSYIASSDEKAQPHLREIRQIVKATLPEAEEAIRWGVPWYRYHGMVAGVTAYKNHVTLEIWADELQSVHRQMFEDQGYKTGKRTVQIRYDEEVPTAAIQTVLKAQAEANEARRARKD